jgi:hypothetical protein
MIVIGAAVVCSGVDVGDEIGVEIGGGEVAPPHAVPNRPTKTTLIKQ